jgi:hypothetical protein
MKSAIAATMAVAAGLVLANMLGVAAAEAPTTTTATPVRTITVDGVASVPIAQGANRAVATAVYREGMAGAVADGQSKAEFLAGKTASTLGNVQSVVEGNGSIECTGEELNSYVQYQGEQPDFGTPESASRVVAPEAASAPAVHKPQVAHPKKKKRKRKPSAKAATATTCTLSTDVTLVYAIS